MTIKKIEDYINLVESEGTDLEKGDGFIFELNDEDGIETEILESWGDSILVQLDAEGLSLIQDYGVQLLEETDLDEGRWGRSSYGYNPDRDAEREWDAYQRGDDDFRNQERNAGLEDERNNIQVVINGKKWKVFPGHGRADSTEERQHLRKMEMWAERKSAATGKKWEVYLTGADPTTESISEAEYQGRKVSLGKPMAGDVAKSKVYVRKPNGKIVKVNFGDKKLSIKKHIPSRRKSFRARHNCANPGPRWKARYWSCRAW